MPWQPLKSASPCLKCHRWYIEIFQLAQKAIEDEPPTDRLLELTCFPVQHRKHPHHHRQGWAPSPPIHSLLGPTLFISAWGNGSLESEKKDWRWPDCRLNSKEELWSPTLRLWKTRKEGLRPKMNLWTHKWGFGPWALKIMLWTL